MTPQQIKEQVALGNFYTIDEESYFGNKKKISLKFMGVEEFLETIGDDVYLHSVTGPDGFIWVGDPRDFDWEILRDKIICAHNMRFDLAVIEHLRKFDIVPTDLTFAATICTADLSVYFSGQRKLQMAAKYFYNDDMDKGYRDIAEGMHREDFVKPELFEEFSNWRMISETVAEWEDELREVSAKLPMDKLYPEKNITWEQRLARAEKLGISQRLLGEFAWLTVVLAGREDALMCRRIAQDYFCDWPDMEVTMSQMTREGGMKGVYIDQELLDKQIDLCRKVREECLHKLPWYDAWIASGLKTPTARRFVDAQCEVDGIPIPVSMNKANEKYLEWLAVYGDEYAWIDAIRKWNNAHKTLTTFETCKRRIREDGTMPFGLMYFGAHTGRWSGAQRYNMQNMLKSYREENHPLASIDARGIHIPKPGHKFIISDLSQIEWRVLRWLAKDWEALEIAKTVHPYVAGAVAMGSWDLKDGDVAYLKKEKPTLYSTFKMQSLALQFGTGFKKFIVMLPLFGCDPYEVIGSDPTEKQILDFKDYLDYMDRFTKSRMFTFEFRIMEKEDPKKFRLHVCSWAMVKEWRERNPKITNLWNTLGGAFERAIASGRARYILQFSADPTVEPQEGYSDTIVPGSPEFVIRLPNGRDLTYHLIGKTRDGGLKCKTDLYSRGKNSWVYTFPGKLAENVDQSLSRDVFAWQAAQLYYEGIPALWTSHDELVTSCSETRAADVCQQVNSRMSMAPPWMSRLVVGADTEITSCYCKG